MEILCSFNFSTNLFSRFNFSNQVFFPHYLRPFAVMQEEDLWWQQLQPTDLFSLNFKSFKQII